MVASLFDLNEDCLHHLCSFLTIDELLKASLNWDLFDVTLMTRLKSTPFVASHIRCQLSIPELRQILTKFSAQINLLTIDEPIDWTQFQFYKVIAEYCSNVKTFDLCYPSEQGLQIYEKLLTHSKHARSIVVRQYQKENIRDIDTKLCTYIGRLKELKVLNVSNLVHLTGEQLQNLTQLEELSIAHCSAFKQRHFIKICEQNSLKKLNITGCMLDNEALGKVAEIETLNSLEISDALLANNYEVIGDIKNLTQFVYHIYENVKFDQIIERLASHRKSALDTLIITCDQLIASGVYHSMWPRILSFENIRILHIPVGFEFDRNDFVEIAKHFSNLEDLVLRFSDWKFGDLIFDDFYKFLKFSKKLKQLTVYPHEFCEQSCEKNVTVRRNLNDETFTVNLAAKDMSADLIELDIRSTVFHVKQVAN